MKHSSSQVKENLSILAETPPRPGQLLSASDLWLRAQEARAIATTMQHDVAKLGMLGIAETYERLARHAAERAFYDVDRDPSP
jgi:hydroxymethylpyrimidine/phosphomethylpyrimidine kinase